MSPADVRALLDSIVKGASRDVADMSLAEFISLYDQLLKRVDQSHTDATVVLADGQAWVTFPRLSRQVLKVSEARPLTRQDLRLTSPGKVSVIGGNHRSSLSFLREDLRDGWFVPVGLAVAIVVAAMATEIGPLALSVAPLLALAASVFIAIFVLFGVGEVVRAASLQSDMFRSGQLQRYLDADRYLVRLAVLGFTLALAVVIAEPVRVGLLAKLSAIARESVTIPAIGLVALLLWASATATLLCLRAAAGYLLDRAAGSLLLGLGEEAIKATHIATEPADATSPAETPSGAERS